MKFVAADPVAETGRARAGRSSDLAYADLREAIMTLVLPPGTPLSDRDLALRYGTSRTPVREALLRLSEEGLVSIVPKSGTVVARIPVTAVREANVARRALEAETVRGATRIATASRLMELRAILERQRECAAVRDEKAFLEADNAFHAGIAAAAGLPGIWGMIQQIRVHSERFRRLTLPQTGRMDMIVSEHTAVLDAIVRGDAETAVASMDLHLSRLPTDMEDFRSHAPEYFLFD